MSKATRVYIGTRKGLFVYDIRGNEATLLGIHHQGARVSNSCIDNKGQIWACLDHGHWSQKLSRSSDDGNTWEEIEAPAYPEGATFSNWGKKDLPATLKYQWEIVPGIDNETVYIGTIPGGLFKWTGDGWELDQGLWGHPTRDKWFGGGMDDPGIHSIVTDQDDADHLLVALSCSGVFETADGGASWQTRNEGMRAGFLPDTDDAREVGYDPHRVVRSPADKKVLWQQNHEGIYVSRDGAKTWESVSKDGTHPHFGFAVVASASAGGTAWVLPARSDMDRMALDDGLCLYRTDDFGATWKRQDAGLPTESFDICYRHALDIHGETLVFGSTTGNLFVTDNGGRTFKTISNYLPPIYSVNFR